MTDSLFAKSKDWFCNARVYKNWMEDGLPVCLWWKARRRAPGEECESASPFISEAQACPLPNGNNGNDLPVLTEGGVCQLGGISLKKVS